MCVGWVRVLGVVCGVGEGVGGCVWGGCCGVWCGGLWCVYVCVSQGRSLSAASVYASLLQAMDGVMSSPTTLHQPARSWASQLSPFQVFPASSIFSSAVLLQVPRGLPRSSAVSRCGTFFFIVYKCIRISPPKIRHILPCCSFFRVFSRGLYMLLSVKIIYTAKAFHTLYPQKC